MLPFANLSADNEQEYFSDGLAEEIINLLDACPGSEGIARTSAFAFRGKNEDIRRDRRGAWRDECSRRERAPGGQSDSGHRPVDQCRRRTHLWSERYDRELTDVFAVQDEIAAAIAGALQVKLTGKTDSARHEPNLPAYEAFLKGRHQYYKHCPKRTRAPKSILSRRSRWTRSGRILTPT